MRKIFIAAILLAALACNSRAPKSEMIPVEGVPVVVDSTKGSLDFAGAEVELIKKLLSAAEKGDWDAARACFADSAVIFANQWAPDTTQKGVPIADALESEKKLREEWENVKYGDPIIEVVTTATGEKYAHFWARYSAKNKKTGKTIDCPVFASYLVKDNKLQWEWVIYDSKQLE
jgi:hypothetical protein